MQDSFIDARGVCDYLSGNVHNRGDSEVSHQHREITGQIKLVVAEGADHGEWVQDSRVVRSVVRLLRDAVAQLRDARPS